MHFCYIHTVGTFDDLKATRYCIDLENTVISPQQDLDEEEELVKMNLVARTCNCEGN